MSTQKPGDQPQGSQRPDEIDELFGRGNPNPNRAGCPPRDIIVAMAHRALPIGDPAYQHLGECSPCYQDVRSLQAASGRIRAGIVFLSARRLLVAALLVMAVASAAWFRTERGGSKTLVELDLRPFALTRSEVGSVHQPLSLPRTRVDLTLILPAGSEPGRYEVQLVGAGAGPRRLGAGEAEVRDFVTTLHTELDLHAVLAGGYQLAIIGRGDARQLFPVELR
jgi:hypothetical protein